MTIKVRLGHGVVEAEMVQETEHTVWVRLKNGAIVKRKKTRDVVDG